MVGSPSDLQALVFMSSKYSSVIYKNYYLFLKHWNPNEVLKNNAQTESVKAMTEVSSVVTHH